MRYDGGGIDQNINKNQLEWMREEPMYWIPQQTVQCNLNPYGP